MPAYHKMVFQKNLQIQLNLTAFMEISHLHVVTCAKVREFLQSRPDNLFSLYLDFSFIDVENVDANVILVKIAGDLLGKCLFLYDIYLFDYFNR